MQKTKKILIGLLIFIFGLGIAFAAVSVWKGDNWDAGQIEGADSSNDQWVLTGSIDIEDSTSTGYIVDKLRGSIYNYSINSDLFGDFSLSGTINPIKFYATDDYFSILPLECNSSVGAEVYEFKSGNKIKSDYWGELEIDEEKSYFCSNQKIHLEFISDHLALKKIGVAETIGIDVFGKQQINVNGVVKVGGNIGSGMLARGDQRTLNLDIGNSDRALLREQINKNISKLYLNYKDTVIDDNYLIDTNLDNSGNDIDKIYLYNYKGKIEGTTIKYNGTDYINQGKNLVIGNSDGGITKVQGKNTIIVKSGNIYIRNNLDNTDDTKDLLVIISKRDKDGNGGNIYINPEVTNIDAVLIADGSILSYNGNIQGAGYAPNILRKQLLIFGSIMSSNSVGDDKIPYGADYYQKMPNNIFNKSIYDLGNLRTFNLKYGINPGSNCLDETKLAPINGTGNFVLNAWAGHRKCYLDDIIEDDLRGTLKTNPLVIEYNSNITKIKPYIIGN